MFNFKARSRAPSVSQRALDRGGVKSYQLEVCPRSAGRQKMSFRKGKYQGEKALVSRPDIHQHQGAQGPALTNCAGHGSCIFSYPAAPSLGRIGLRKVIHKCPSLPRETAHSLHSRGDYYDNSQLWGFGLKNE